MDPEPDPGPVTDPVPDPDALAVARATAASATITFGGSVELDGGTSTGAATYRRHQMILEFPATRFAGWTKAPQLPERCPVLAAAGPGHVEVPSRFTPRF